MFAIKPLDESDYDFAIELANTMDWNMAAEDFNFMSLLEPGGCFLLLDNTQPIGIASCISYGKIGWFGNLIVREKYRKKGAGSTLVTHALNHLHTRGVETVGLYAYPHLLDFYAKFGFSVDTDFSVLHTQTLCPITANPLPKINKSKLPAIVRFDSYFFGGNREELLKSILFDKANTSCCITNNDGEILGYVAATVYEKAAWIGPLVCQPQRNDIATALVKSVLGELASKQVYAVIPKKDPLATLFFSAGFRETFFVSRMVLGQTNTKNCIYLAESLERG